MMRVWVLWVVLGAGVLGSDLDRVIDIVYNPSAGPFQDTSKAFYQPRQGQGRALKSQEDNFIFPSRLDVGRKPAKYRKDSKNKTSKPKKAKLLRNGKKIDVEGGLDFGQAVFDERMGKRCILKKEAIDTVEKTPTLVCTHRAVTQCHYTYITKYQPGQEEVCEDRYLKQCRISYRQGAHNETVRECRTPVTKVCDGQGEVSCRTVYEATCSTKYVEKQPGKFVRDSVCQKIPVELCGAGCTFQDGAEECRDKTTTSVVDIPEEVCDLNPQKMCRLVTKLAPKLEPVKECTSVPKETCQLKYSKPSVVKKPIITKWCLDEDDLETDEVERSAPDPVLDTRRTISQDELSDVEQDSLNRLR